MDDTPGIKKEEEEEEARPRGHCSCRKELVGWETRG